MIRPILIAVAFVAMLPILRFGGFLPALAFGLLAGAGYLAYERLMRPVRATGDALPLDGISLHIEDTPKVRLVPPPRHCEDECRASALVSRCLDPLGR